MHNPVLVEATRGPLVESRHRGAVAVVDAAGTVRLALGDIGRPVFPRSAVKGLQALALIESGAADRFGLTDEMIALACASHSGEPAHVATARAMLAAGGIAETCLACGAHWPRRRDDVARMGRDGETPGPIHSNCSGKHAGFLCTAAAMGVDPAGYEQPGHPVMARVTETMEAMMGVALESEARGTDGCSIPAYAAPLHAVARAFARLASGEGITETRAAAAARIRAAVAAHPFMVAGTRRFCTRAMEILGARAFVKVGAEGVYVAALPDSGLGIAIKIDDGAARAAEVAVAALIGQFVAMDEAEAHDWRDLAEPAIRNWRGDEVGRLRAAPALAQAPA